MTAEADSENTADYWFKQGLECGRQGNTDGAIEAYQKAVDLDPNHFRAWFNMGIRYGKIPKNVKAKECFEKAVALKKEDPIAHYSLAVINNLLGLIEDSVHHYGEAIRLNPEFAKAHSNLATVHYSVKQGREAIKHLLIAEKLFKDQGDYLMAETAESLLKECYAEFRLSREDFPEVA